MAVRRALAAALAVLAAAAVAQAASTRIFRLQSADSFLRGESDGVAIEADGVLTLARRAERVAELEEPFALALVGYGDGWAIGTGNDGKVLAVTPRGEVSTLLDADASEVFALAVEPDGSLLAGSSPDGALFRIGREGGEAREIFDPEETYIWAVARDTAGTIWVATGAPGRLYRLAKGAEPERVWDGGADHVRSLAVLAGGDVLFGTAGDARLLRWRDGKVRTLHDSELNELVAIAPLADGSVAVAALSSEASFVDLTPRASSAESGESSSTVTVTVEESSSGAGSRPAGARVPRSKLLRVAPSGATEELWSSADETIFALAGDGVGLWAGTGLDGRLYRIADGRARVEKEVEAKQVVGIAAGAAGPTLLTTNGAALWRLGDGRERRGTYTGPVLDALQVARFGVLRWRGVAPRGASVEASFRTGFSSEPDATWTDWQAIGGGADAALAGAEPGRFVQFRLELAATGESPRVSAVELSYRQENVRPSIESLTALDPGQIVVPAGFNPSEQAFEPTSPNREGIFDTLEPASREERMKTLWKTGWRTLRWEASDPNGDDLRYRLEVRPEGSPDAWIELADELDTSHHSFDAAALPDGLYRFRLTASDGEDNREPGRALEAHRVSEPVQIDHAPPEVRRVRREKGALRVSVYDAASPLRSAELSIDGAAWEPTATADGLLDGRDEELVIDPAPADANLLLLRLTDASFNVRTFDLGAELGR